MSYMALHNTNINAVSSFLCIWSSCELSGLIGQNSYRAMQTMLRHRYYETKVDSSSMLEKIDFLPYSRRLVREPAGWFNIVRNTMRHGHNDGGRKAAGYKGDAGDCVARAIAVASGCGGKVESRSVGSWAREAWSGRYPRQNVRLRCCTYELFAHSGRVWP